MSVLTDVVGHVAFLAAVFIAWRGLTRGTAYRHALAEMARLSDAVNAVPDGVDATPVRHALTELLRYADELAFYDYIRKQEPDFFDALVRDLERRDTGFAERFGARIDQTLTGYLLHRARY